MKRRPLIALTGVVALSLAACAYDFGQFTYTGGADGAAPDGGGPEPDAAMNGMDSSVPPNDSSPPADTGGGGRDSFVPDSASFDANPPPDANDAAACTDPCTSTAKTCATTCNNTLNSCLSGCPTGNAGKGCRMNCQSTATMCTQACVTTCDKCTTSAGCSDPSGCTAATM